MRAVGEELQQELRDELKAGAARSLVFLGPPGAGKGTQAREISRRLGVPHISTGEMFREHVAKGTQIGLLARSIMESGELVPDSAVTEMVRGRLAEADCANGFLLDGYPRTVPQAEALAEILHSSGQSGPIVVNIELRYNEIVRRLGGRRVCPQCRRTYNIYFQPPVQEGVCDDDGASLEQRADDREEAIRERMSAYEAQTAPLIDFYRKQGRLVEVDGSRSPEQVSRALSDFFQVS